MSGPSTLERGTADRGITTDPDVAAILNEERDLRQRITAAVRERGTPVVTSIEMRAHEAVNNVVPLRKVWATGEWNDPWSRWIFLRFYLSDLAMLGPSGRSGRPDELSEAELVRRILAAEREYQRLARVNGDRWIAHRIQRHVAAVADQEYKEYLRLIKQIRDELAHQQRMRPLQVAPARIQSTIFRASGAAWPLLEVWEQVKDFVSLALDFVPIVGQLKAIAEAALGFDVITGRELAAWERGLIAGLSLLPFAKGVFRGGRAVVRGARAVGRAAAAAGRYSLDHLAALAVRLGDRVDPRALYQAMKGLSGASEQAMRAAAKIPAGKALTAAQKEGVRAVARFSADAGPPTARTASGVIDGGRATSRSASGEIAPPRRAAPAARAAAESLSEAAQSLVARGYAADAVRAMEEAGVRLTVKLAGKLAKLGDVGRDFVNTFHRCPGFAQVVADLGFGRGKAIGAEFVMRYATLTGDIVRKARADPMLIAFERGATINKSRRGDVFGRVVDIVVRGDRTIGEGATIYTELKSWTRFTLSRAKGKSGKLIQQFVRDSTISREIKWVFDGTKLTRKQVLDTFVEIIQRDGYLAAKWGSDAAAIRAALEDVVTMFP